MILCPQNHTNQNNGINGGDKIEEDQTLSAACLLVCEWANKLLGRVFTTLVELARFLVGGSYVSSKSMAAFVVMSNTDNITRPQINHSANSLFSPQKHEAPLIIPKRTKQFPKKIPAPRSTHSAGTSILPKTQPQQHSPLHKQHIQPKSTTNNGQIQFYQPTHSQLSTTAPSTPTTGYQKMRPPTPSLMSPTGSNQALPQTPSPFQASPKFSAPGTPHSRPMTPSSNVTQPRQQSIEPTRFLFSPITNEQKPAKTETSPPTLRPTATHPGNQSQEWQSGGTNQTQMNINDIPVSPSKQPRLSLQCTPVTPTRRSNSFPYPITSPRTPQRVTNQQYVTSPPMMSPGTPRSVMNVQSPNVQQRNQEMLIIQGQDVMGNVDGLQRGNDSSPNVQVADQMIKQG